MGKKLLLLPEVAKRMAYKNGKPLTLPAVRYRIKKSNRAGAGIVLQKAPNSKGRMVDAVTPAQAEKLCQLWRNLHL